MRATIYLVRIDKDPVIWRLVKRPVVMWDGKDVAMIPKTQILCDACNAPVREREDDPELPPGYAVVEEEGDEKWIIEVVCERCRRRYLASYAVRSSIGGDD